MCTAEFEKHVSHNSTCQYFLICAGNKEKFFGDATEEAFGRYWDPMSR